MKFNKKFLIILFVAAAAGVVIWNVLTPKAPEYKTEAAVLGSITQEITETGSVKKGEALDLNFKNAGAVAKANVKKGDRVVSGQLLAELDDRQLQVQLAQARANLELYNLQLEKLEAGAAIEDIEIVQSQAQAAQTALANAQESLADSKATAGQALNSAYKTAADALSAAYIKTYNAYNFADLLQRTYFTPQNDDSIEVFEIVQKINLAVGKIKNYANAAQANGKDSGLDPVFGSSKSLLGEIEIDLRAIRAICEKLPWRDSVSQAYKDSLDIHIGYLVTGQATFNSAVESVALQKVTNDAAVNSAQSAVNAAAAALETASGQLEKTVAPARAEDKGILEAQIAQAKAQIALLELQIADSKLTAPVDGQIAEMNIKAGETISVLSSAAAIVLLPTDPYEVIVDIYEEEAINLEIGDATRIFIAAIPDKVFNGYVSAVDPAGKLVNGVVYYETKIAFEDTAPETTKPEMTADVEIITAEKDGVLLISESAIRRRENRYFAQVLKSGAPEEVEVEVGIRSDGMAEILSGLSEGDEIIIP